MYESIFFYSTMKQNRSFQTNLITVIDFKKVQKYSRIVDTYQRIYYNIQNFSNKNKNWNGRNTSIKFLRPSNESVWLPFHGSIYKFDPYIFRNLLKHDYFSTRNIQRIFDNITHRDEILLLCLFCLQYVTESLSTLTFEIIFHEINLYY